MRCFNHGLLYTNCYKTKLLRMDLIPFCSLFSSLSISFSSLDKIGNPHTSYDFCLKQHNSIDLFKYIFYFYEMRMNENHKPTSPSYCSFILECFEYFDMYCLFLKNQNLEKFYIFLFHNALIFVRVLVIHAIHLENFYIHIYYILFRC